MVTEVAHDGAFATPDDAEVIASMPPRAANRSSIVLSAGERAQLERWVRANTSPQRLVRRSRIVLLAAQGCSIRQTARMVGVSERTVMLWRRRFVQDRLAGLGVDRGGRGRKPSIAPDIVTAVLRDGAASRSSRATALAHGISPSSVRRLWRRNTAGVRRRTAKR